MKTIKSAKSALATFLGWDMADLKEYEYQSGRYTKTVYALDDAYYCSSKDGKNLPEPKTQMNEPLNWIEVKDDYVNHQGWKIFKSK